nr:unnamed protein product [Callosobruchus chinensis]
MRVSGKTPGANAAPPTL